MSDKDEIQKKIDAATEGLKAKNKELLGKLKKQQEIVNKVKDLDIDALLKTKKEYEKIIADRQKKKGEYKKMWEEQEKTHSTEVQLLKDQIEKLKNEALNIKKVNLLRSKLIEKDVDKVLLDVAERALLPDMKITDDVATISGKPIEKFMEEWVVSDIGKRFVSDGNSGGGAHGPGGKVVPEADYFNPESKSFNLTKQAEIANNNPALYKTLSEKFKQ